VEAGVVIQVYAIASAGLHAVTAFTALRTTPINAVVASVAQLTSIVDAVTCRRQKSRHLMT